MIDKNFFFSNKPAFTPEFIASLLKDISDDKEKNILYKLLKNPKYIGRLLISSRETRYFINPLDGSSRPLKQYETTDIERRFFSLSESDRESALLILNRYREQL